MNPTSVRLDPDTLDELDAEADERGISRNHRIKQIIENRNDYAALRERHDQLQSDYSDLKEELAEVKREKQVYIQNHQEEDERFTRILRERDELERELESTEAKLEDLRRQLQAVNRKEREVDDLVEYVEEERELQLRREERQNAPVWKRAKWWVLGKEQPGRQ